VQFQALLKLNHLLLFHTQPSTCLLKVYAYWELTLSKTTLLSLCEARFLLVGERFLIVENDGAAAGFNVLSRAAVSHKRWGLREIGTRDFVSCTQSIEHQDL
jgi:hypothetical protein